MAFMHQINIKRGLLIIGVSTLLLGTALFTNNNNEKNKLSEDIQRLDAALLSEVSNQDIEMDQQVFDVMDCAGVTESQPTGLGPFCTRVDAGPAGPPKPRLL